MTDKQDVRWTYGGAAARVHQQLCGMVAGEYRLRPTNSGIVTNVVDPANVTLARVRVDPGVTGEYDAGTDDDETVPEFAVTDTLFKRAVSSARKGRGNGHGDPVTVGFDAGMRRVTVVVDRDLDGQQMVHETRFTGIDPDAVRKEPNLPDLSLSTSAHLSGDALCEALCAVVRKRAHIRVRTDADDTKRLILESETDSGYERVELPDVCDGPGEPDGSLLSADYLGDLRSVLQADTPETVTVRFGNAFPVMIEATWPEIGVDLTYMQAPRIESD